MKSLRNLYKIGHGPSSSHTMGPAQACRIMLERFPDARAFKATLYGSLALTGKGHLTDSIIRQTLAPKEVDVTLRFYSIGGGSLEIKGEDKYLEADVYPENSFKQVAAYCTEHDMNLVEYVLEREDEDIYAYVSEIYDRMEQTIEAGLNTEGYLPGKLNVKRKAKKIANTQLADPNMDFIKNVYANAYATSEENACGGIVVTAPTCGSSGLLPAVIFGARAKFGFSKEKLVNALLVASVFGNLVKQNASISGAEAGCQAEIGVACSMGAACDQRGGTCDFHRVGK